VKTYFVYILQCTDFKTYTGITNNLSRRLEEHQKGLNMSCFTFRRRPVKLIFQQEFNEVNQAIFFEKKSRNGVQRKNML
jgi:putative endonuclease